MDVVNCANYYSNNFGYCEDCKLMKKEQKNKADTKKVSKNTKRYSVLLL